MRFALAALLAIVAAEASAQTPQTPRRCEGVWRIAAGEMTTSDVRVRAGMECAMELSWADGRVYVVGGRVEEQPQNGTVGFDSRSRWVYTPNPGFTGRDSFMVVLGTEVFGRVTPARTRFNVTVR